MSGKARSASPIQEECNEDIDEDPFSHFLSPVVDEDDPFEGSEYSAGINNFDEEVEDRRSRFRVRLGQKWDKIMSRRTSSPSNEQQEPPRTPPSEDQLPDLVTDDARSKSPLENTSSDEEELDGWEGDRQRQHQRSSDFGFPLSRQKLVFGAPLQRPRLRTNRTLSGRKHSFTPPSFHLWDIDEESEPSSETGRPQMRGRRWTRT